MRTPRVLVVDDDPIARAALQEIYGSAGMTAVTAGSAEAFFAELVRATPDLCLVDMILPDSNGLAILAALHARPALARTALIGFTARQDATILVQALQAGADDFVFKPISGEELLARSRLAIVRKRLTAPLGGIRGSQRIELTTLFCDVRGFTAFASGHDPESIVELLNGLFERLAAQVAQRGGEVDKYMGDGMLAFFGLHLEHRDKELHAIEAALAMVAAAEDYSRESLMLGGRSLLVGAGVATGEVVIAPVGAADRRQVTAIGDSVNLASRIEGVAGEGEVVICERTYERLAHAVVTSGPRHVELKGIPAGRVYPVTAIRPEAWLR